MWLWVRAIFSRRAAIMTAQVQPVYTESETLITGFDSAPCRRCGKPKKSKGLCDDCTSEVLGTTAAAKNEKVERLQADRLGPQTSFYLMAFIVLPISFSLALVGTALLHPQYSLAQTVLAAMLMSSWATFGASWLVLFVAASQQDVVSAMLALRNFTRIYQHAEHFRQTMPKLFTLLSLS